MTQEECFTKHFQEEERGLLVNMKRKDGCYRIVGNDVLGFLFWVIGIHHLVET